MLTRAEQNVTLHTTLRRRDEDIPALLPRDVRLALRLKASAAAIVSLIQSSRDSNVVVQYYGTQLGKDHLFLKFT